jgi:hypothetical protein
MRTELILVALSLSACTSDVDYFFSRTGFSGDGAFICSDDTEITVTETEKETALVCLGLKCGSVTPDSATCANSAMNKLANTCASEFFACYQPSGACMTEAAGFNHSFDNGARYTYAPFVKLFPPGSSEPCISGDTINTDGILWARFR